jgi:hypothetical protein
MASVSADAAQQLWLDVARPVQPRPPRERRARAPAPQIGPPASSARQMELVMAAAPVVRAVPVRGVPAVEALTPTCPPVVGAAPPPTDSQSTRPCFVTWLRGQEKGKGPLSELAKAARADASFPRRGSAEEVRIRFSRAGADGDAFAALEDAERAYDRAVAMA